MWQVKMLNEWHTFQQSCHSWSLPSVPFGVLFCVCLWLWHLIFHKLQEAFKVFFRKKKKKSCFWCLNTHLCSCTCRFLLKQVARLIHRCGFFFFTFIFEGMFCHPLGGVYWLIEHLSELKVWRDTSTLCAAVICCLYILFACVYVWTFQF